MSETMSKRLVDIVEAHGTFPPEPQVLEGFDRVLAIAAEETDPAVAEALLELIEQHSEVARAMPDDLAARICDWVAGAMLRPGAPGEPLAQILVNAGTERSLALLRDMAREGQSTAQAAQPYLAQHSLLRGQSA